MFAKYEDMLILIASQNSVEDTKNSDELKRNER